MKHAKLITKALELAEARATPKSFWEWDDEKPKTGRPSMRFVTRYGIVSVS